MYSNVTFVNNCKLAGPKQIRQHTLSLMLTNASSFLFFLFFFFFSPFSPLFLHFQISSSLFTTSHLSLSKKITNPSMKPSFLHQRKSNITDQGKKKNPDFFCFFLFWTINLPTPFVQQFDLISFFIFRYAREGGFDFVDDWFGYLQSYCWGFSVDDFCICIQMSMGENRREGEGLYR